MIGRLLAACGWLAWQVRRRSRRYGRMAPRAVGVAFLVVALAPVAIPLFDAQPQDVTVDRIRDGEVPDPAAWVRLEGRLQPLVDSPTGIPGNYALLIDTANSLRAIAVRANEAIELTAHTVITGHLTAAGVLLTEELPIEATVFGTPPVVVEDRLLELDTRTTPPRASLWPLAIPPLLLGAGLLVGARTGYPVFRPSSEIDVVSTPLGPGERIPAAFGGRIGPTGADLADPSAALLIVRHEPKGNVLTAQALPDGGGIAPQPVPIGGGWTNGRVGHVFAVSETVPALRVRSEQVDATFLFAKSSERDRVAALIAVER